MGASGDFQLSDVLGTNGKYQMFALFTSWYTSIAIGQMGVFVEFLAPTVDLYWSSDDSNRTVFPSTKCIMKEVIGNNYSDYFNSSATLIYESKYSRNTITEKFNLVCERSWLVSFSNSLLMIGSLVGSLVSGRLSEKYGRRQSSICLLLGALLSNLCLLFPVNYIMFAIACFVYGVTCINSYIIFIIQTLEMVPNSRRPIYGTIGKYGILFGQTMIAGASWLFKDWFYVQLFQTVFIATCLPFALYVIESPSYLVVRKKPEAAKKNIMIIAKRNGLDLNDIELKADSWLQHMKQTMEEEASIEDGKIVDLFKSPVITRYTFCLCFISSCVNFTYYGLLMNVESIGSDMYEDLAISNVLSLLSIIVTMALLTKVSLKIIHVFCLTMMGVTCAVYPVFYQYAIARTVITALARVFSSPVCILCNIYVLEVYPTSVRVVGTGFAQMAARACAAFSPFTKELGEATVAYAPFLLFSPLNFLGAFLMKFLPETKNKPLAQTVKDLDS